MGDADIARFCAARPWHRRGGIIPAARVLAYGALREKLRNSCTRRVAGVR